VVKKNIVEVLNKWFHEGYGKVSHVGEVRETLGHLENLKGIPGFDGLENLLSSLITRPKCEEVWEEIEHAFAVLKEANRYKEKGCKVELEETLGQKDQKKPDFRAFVQGRWVYFEVKVSSMFPGEKVFLDTVLKGLNEDLPLVSFPSKYCLVLKYRESNANTRLSFLLERIRSLSQQVLNVPVNKTSDIYVDSSQEVTVILLSEKYSTKILRNLLEKCMDVVNFIDVSMVINQIAQNGYYVIALDERIPKYSGDVFGVVEAQGMLIGRLSKGFEEARLKSCLLTTLGKGPRGAPYVVVVYAREVILGKFTQTAISEIFNDIDLKEISALILEIETATGSRGRYVHRRQAFRNACAKVKISLATLG